MIQLFPQICQNISKMFFLLFILLHCDLSESGDFLVDVPEDGFNATGKTEGGNDYSEAEDHVVKMIPVDSSEEGKGKDYSLGQPDNSAAGKDCGVIKRTEIRQIGYAYRVRCYADSGVKKTKVKFQKCQFRKF